MESFIKFWVKSEYKGHMILWQGSARVAQVTQSCL